jgi:hypothetical protein
MMALRMTMRSQLLGLVNTNTGPRQEGMEGVVLVDNRPVKGSSGGPQGFVI